MRKDWLSLALLLLAISNAGAVPAKLTADPPKKENTGDTASTPAAQKPVKRFSTVDGVMAEYGKLVRTKLKPLFSASGVDYPPKQMTWICLKEEKQLCLFAKDRTGKMKQVLKYPIIGASGVAGPKLKEGDKQVPEGFYKIDGFRPNLVAHIGMSVNYPNDEDRKHALKEKRTNLGCDILIHGSRWSTGCLAMGNEPIEEMFVLAHDTGKENIELIFSPCRSPLKSSGVDMKKQAEWVPGLYKRLDDSLRTFSFLD